MQAPSPFPVSAVEAAPAELPADIALKLCSPFATLVADENNLAEFMLPAGPTITTDKVLSKWERHSLLPHVDVRKACVAEIGMRKPKRFSPGDDARD